MTKDEYRAALEALGLSQVGGARFLGVGDKTSRNWASGRSEVPPPVARFLRFLIAAKITPDEVNHHLAA